MKKTNNNNSSNTIKHRVPVYRRPLVWIVAAIIIIGAIFAIIFLNNAASKPGSEQEKTKTTSSSQDDKPQAESEQTIDSNEPEPEPKTIQYEGENPNKLDELTGTVTGTYVDNGVLTIMTTVDQYLNGSCALSMVGDNTGDTYSTTSNLLADVSVSYCEPFNIPLSVLMNDHYQIEITLSGNGKTGKIKDGVDL